MSSTEFAAVVMTYAQKLCCGAASARLPGFLRYQSNSERKSLIYIETLNCFFSGHFKRSLDLQGLAACRGNLSTKLSTENLEIFKPVLNQGLSAQSGCAFEEMPLSAGLETVARRPLQPLLPRVQ